MDFIDQEKVTILKFNLNHFFSTNLLLIRCVPTTHFTDNLQFNLLPIHRVNNISLVPVLQKIRHSKFKDLIDAALHNKKYISGVDNTFLDMCYPAIIQSGGNYQLKFSTERFKQNSAILPVIIEILSIIEPFKLLIYTTFILYIAYFTSIHPHHHINPTSPLFYLSPYKPHCSAMTTTCTMGPW